MATHELLDTTGMLEDFFFDATLIGIACSMPCYQFCWLVNESFGTDFEMVMEIEFKATCSSPDYFFPVYRYDLPLNGGELLIYSLKTGRKRLLPELKNLDYLWLIRGHASGASAESILAALQRLPQITLATRLRLEQLPSAKNLLV